MWSLVKVTLPVSLKRLGISGASHHHHNKHPLTEAKWVGRVEVDGELMRNLEVGHKEKAGVKRIPISNVFG